SALNLNGTWSGFVGAGSGGGNALRVTWMATQSGSSVSGPATMLTSPPVTNIAFSGTLTGMLIGSQLTLSYVGSPANSLGFGECLLSANGSGVASSGTIAGNLTVTFASCAAVSLQPPASSQLTLTKE